MSARRDELTGADKAVSEVLDEINHRMHGLMSGGSYHREFLDWLAQRGFQVVYKPPTPQVEERRCAARIWPSWANRYVTCGELVRSDGRCWKYDHRVEQVGFFVASDTSRPPATDTDSAALAGAVPAPTDTEEPGER